MLVRNKNRRASDAGWKIEMTQSEQLLLVKNFKSGALDA